MAFLLINTRDQDSQLDILINGFYDNFPYPFIFHKQIRPQKRTAYILCDCYQNLTNIGRFEVIEYRRFNSSVSCLIQILIDRYSKPLLSNTEHILIKCNVNRIS